MMNTIIIIANTCLVFSATAFIASGFIEYLKAVNFDDSELKKKTKERLVQGLFMCIAAFVISDSEAVKESISFFSEKIEAAEERRQQKYETYDIYLDGQPVEYGTIDIDQYDVSIDNENESIYLTNKKETSWFPVFFPIYR